MKGLAHHDPASRTTSMVQKKRQLSHQTRTLEKKIILILLGDLGRMYN